MFADDISLVREMVAKYGPATQPIVEVGGLERPCVADYARTIDAMKTARTPEEVHAAQHCRYLDIVRPLSFLGDYVIENPETGGLPVEDLHTKYPGRIGTAILLSVLEHVANPFTAIERLRMAMADGGLCVVSVPWVFPEHYGPNDFWRFNVGALRELFSGDGWVILEACKRLDIPATAGVLEIQTGQPQAIRSTCIVARSV